MSKVFVIDKSHFAQISIATSNVTKEWRKKDRNEAGFYM